MCSTFHICFSPSKTGSRERSQDFLANAPTIPSKRDHSGETAADELDLPLFDINTLIIATNKFSDANKLGQGGFGIVYKVINLYSKDYELRNKGKLPLMSNSCISFGIRVCWRKVRK